MISTLPAFTDKEKEVANDLLSAKVATMLGRKMEEGDWDFVYCNAKKIPQSDWSNLHIDINYDGIGVEHKMLRVTKPGSILSECGLIKMHPAGTRSIRIPGKEDPTDVMVDILNQYNDLIDLRTKHVLSKTEKKYADMRTGWLLWKDSLDEFLYFEEKMSKVNPERYYATWSVTSAKGSRKESRSLWIYDHETSQKKFSITTTAGAKIQPYFQVPLPDDKNLYHFCVQGVYSGGGLIKVWLTISTAKYLELLLGDLSTGKLSEAIKSVEIIEKKAKKLEISASDIAIPLLIEENAYKKLKTTFEPISDEYMFQQLATVLGEI